MPIHVPANYEPRSYQRRVFDAITRGVTRILLCWHRRSGKDLTSLALMAMQMVQTVGNYFYILPTYAQGRKSVWDNKDGQGRAFLDVFPVELIADKNETEMSITLTNTSRLQILGSDQVDRLRGVNFKGAVFSEFGWQDPYAWRVLSPVAVEAGAWVLFVSTPNGRNAFWQMYEQPQDDPAWFVSRCTIADTTRDARGEDGSSVITPEAVAEEIRCGMPDELAQQEYYVTPMSGLVGSYYGKLLATLEREGRIGEVPWNPALPVGLALDLGFADSTAVWYWQRIGPTMRLIEYEEHAGLALTDWIRLFKQKPYILGQCIAPHDLEVTELTSGITRREVARQLGLNFDIAPKLSVAEGIDAVRRLLPQCWFDQAKCARGLGALGAYARSWDERNKLFSERPEHSWASHGSDAFRYLALTSRDPATIVRPTWTCAEMRFDVFNHAKDSGREGQADVAFDVFRGR